MIVKHQAERAPPSHVDESGKTSQVHSVDKSSLSRASHYSHGLKHDPYEGGSRRGGGGRDEGRDAAGKKAMNLFKQNDPLGQNHVNDVG